MDKPIDVVVVGELNIDLILNQIDALPKLGEEKIAQQMILTLGSSSAIFASNLSSLGAKVSFLGKIGRDLFADLVLKSLNAKQVDTSWIIQDEDLATGATIVMSFENERAMVTHPGAMEMLGISEISDELLKKAKHLHFSNYFLQPKLKPDIGTLFKRAKSLGLTTSFDTQVDPVDEWDIDLPSVLPYVDVFLPNESEALNLTKKSSIEAALDYLADIGNIIVIKEGVKGSISKSGQNISKVPAFLNENVVDAIGAGDSFNSGFIFKFIQGCSIEECQTFGNLTGAVSTTQAGGTTAFTNFDDVMQIGRKLFNYNH
ncbi:carbohydrate kinase family protein [candidate division KSB1 bacterium]|nr:carbohydrate kinase family protein [candidate division KSB1 bacterium]